MKTLEITGSINASVTRKNVRNREAPDMRLLSSSAGSIERNASTSSRKVNGIVYWTMCQTTPEYE